MARSRTPEKAVITLTDPETGGAMKAMNPAHILYELETGTMIGDGQRSLPPR